MLHTYSVDTPRGPRALQTQGVGGGVNNVPLDIHLHDDLFLLIASTGSRHTDALRLIDDVGLGWGGGGGVNLVGFHSFIHSFIFSAV